jgi:hypothetical protein
LYPVPAISGDVIKYWTISTIDVVAADGDSPAVPTHFYLDIVQYCILRARQKDEQPEVAELHLREWRDRMSQAKDEVGNYNDSYSSVRDIETALDYSYESWV